MDTILDTIPKPELEGFCHRWQITELALFGSVLRDDFRPDSDVDILVTFAEDAHWGLLDHVQMEMELAEILGRPVDLVTRRSVEHSENWLRKEHILSSARPWISIPEKAITYP
jgi:predicted nucleotidyltransferase